MFEAPISMMAQTVFPRIARERNIRFVNRVVMFFGRRSCAFGIYVCVFVVIGLCIFLSGNIWRRLLLLYDYWVFL